MNEADFRKELEQFRLQLSKINNNDIKENLTRYFETYWLSEEKLPLWAYFKRKGSGTNTNMGLENLHR